MLIKSKLIVAFHVFNYTTFTLNHFFPVSFLVEFLIGFENEHSIFNCVRFAVAFYLFDQTSISVTDPIQSTKLKSSKSVT